MFCFAARSLALPSQFGDLDEDGKITVLDVVRLIRHYNGTAILSAAQVIFADVNQDGAVNEADAELLRDVILGRASFAGPPLTKVRETSPAQGEDGVAVTRETIFFLTAPLAETALINTSNLHATFGGRQLLSRVEIASDRKTITLFYLEPLPGSARIQVSLNGAGLTDVLGRALDLEGDGLAGGTAILEFTTLSLTPMENTTVIGRVFASEVRRAPDGTTNQVLDMPLSGVTITVDGREETLRAVTDGSGNFRLNPAPAGNFFVHIDGRTVTNVAAGIRYPDLSYYPFVGKQWVSVAGQQVSIGDVFLPLIVDNTLQQVSAVTETVVRFPAAVVATDPRLADVALQVPAGALFSENGTRGGMIGIAPVASDRLPGPLPPGVNPALVITIQTDGAGNFDRPVPACFPNLPDAETGEKLPAGAKSALWSFNHDTGRFEIVGSMTVADDGMLVCTDPGVGILAPGWHFERQGTSTRGGGSDCDPTGARTGYEPGSQSRPPGRPSNDPCANRSTVRGGSAGDPIQLYSGEMIEEVTDLLIPGRGFDFRWQRTYRSRTGPDTAQGNGWDHPYHVFLEASGNDLTLHDGNGRGDRYTRRPDGSWTRAEFFRVITREADQSLTLMFEDKGRWGFYPLDGSARAGRMSYSEDRNGNRMAFSYDAQGRLSIINDTLGRNITIAYNTDGFIQSVADFAGRSVRYDYFKDGDAGGSFGDLKSATSPSVLNTPNGNDFPNGKTVSYTYSTGFGDERLNHNLLTVTDGRRNDPSDATFGAGPYLINIYSPATDPEDPNYDRVIRQIWGGDILDFVFVPLLPAGPNGFAVMRTMVNDRVGNVTEHFFDAGNRLVRLRQFTGRAIPDQPTTALDNRPKDPLRTGDPDYFETIYEWTSDSLQRRVIHPNGNITEYVYEADLNPNSTPRARGNLRIVRHLPGSHVPAGDQGVIEEKFDYDTDFASCCGFNFMTRSTDGRGNSTRHEYDAKGNRVRTRLALGAVVEEWEYNQFGQTSAHILPPNSSGNRRRDELEYHESGPQRGYVRHEIIDAGGQRLRTSFEYDAVGNVVRLIDARGNDTRRVVNELNQLVRLFSPEVMPGSGIRYEKDFFYDANNNVVRVDTRNLDETGAVQANRDFTTTFEYEMLNLPVRISQEIDATRAAVTEYAYDANRNRTLVRQPEAVSGRQPANVVRTRHDERNLPFQVTAAPGDAAQSTSQTDYDRNGNILRTMDGIEAGPRIMVFEHDGYNRLLVTTDAMGNRHRRQYDAANNAVRVWTEGELDDGDGSTNNVRLAEAVRVFDPLNRLVQEDKAHFDLTSRQAVGDGKSTTLLEYASDSQVIRMSNDNGNAVRFAYDTVNRLERLTDAKGNTMVRAYDPSGNVVATTSTEKSDLGGVDSTFVTRSVFDNLNRVTRRIDNAGQINDFAYDSRNNQVLKLDAARSSANNPGNRTRRIFDGLNRLIETTRVLTSDGTGAGVPSGSIVTRREWDDDSRTTAIYDGNGNPTRFAYDALDRVTRTTLASGYVKTMEYNAHSDGVAMTDANGTVIRQTFDALGRVLRKDISPAAGVARDTTFEVWGYDGLSRTVRAVNDATQVAFAHDSLGNLTRETLDGRATTRTYDGAGNVLMTTYPGGRKIQALFDELEQLKSLVDATTATPLSIALHSYSGPGRLARRSNGNNTQLNLDYDSVKRLTRGTHSRGSAPFEDRDYAWDANSNQTANRDLVPGGFAQAYSYDSAYRLRTVQFSGAITEQRAYQLDAAGNRTAVTGDGDTGAYSLSAVPSADAALNQYSSTPFDQRKYDTNGNLVQITSGGPVANLEFDYMNRLVRYTSGGETARYVYDALGRRVARSVGDGAANTVRYSHFGSQLLEEQDGAGAVQATYVVGTGMNDVISMQRGGQNYWLHADDHLSVRRVTDATGTVVERYDYDEFGNPALFGAAGQLLTSSAVGNPFLFTGHQYDAETGFYHARNRYYDPRSGRFITRDPAGAWGDPMNLGNAFAYVGNNPATLVDPMGLAGMLPQPREFVAPAVTAPASVLLNQGASTLARAAETGAEALRVNNTMATELLDHVDDLMKNGRYVNELYQGTRDVGEEGLRFATKPSFYPQLIHETVDSMDDAVKLTNTHYSMGRAGSWVKEMSARAAALEEEAARLAQRGSRLQTAGRVLGVVGIGVQTGMAAYDNYRNCADAVTSINDVTMTAASGALVMAAPPLAIADLVTGGAVSGGIHNALITPVTVARVAFGRVNGRDANAIKKTYTRFAVGRWAWSAGEWLADAIMD